MPRQAIFEAARRATVMIGHAGGKTFTNTGSGFAIQSKYAGQGVVISAAHVLRPPDGSPPPTHVIIVRPRKPPAGKVRMGTDVIEIESAMTVTHGTHDLGLTKVNFRFPRERMLELATQHQPSIGQEVATFGWPAMANELLGNQTLFTPSAFAGIMSAIYPHPSAPRQTHVHYLTQLPIQSGNSGGPVFELTTGRVIGVVSGRLKVAAPRFRGSAVPTNANKGRDEVRVGLTRVTPITHFQDLKKDLLVAEGKTA